MAHGLLSPLRPPFICGKPDTNLSQALTTGKTLRFLLIEDHEDLGRSVQERLMLEGHAVDLAQTLAQAREFQQAAVYDLVLLDIMLPDGDGRVFLTSQREAGNTTPVIVMTARAAISDRVGTLDMGADDYITKPFDYAELEARCRAILRRRGGVADTRHRHADLTFDPLAGTIEVNGETRELRSRELRLLEVFLGAPGRILSKDHLCDRLFSFSEPVSDNAIEVYVGRLRKKLAGSRLRIDTMRGLGYRLSGT